MRRKKTRPELRPFRPRHTFSKGRGVCVRCGTARVMSPSRRGVLHDPMYFGCDGTLHVSSPACEPRSPDDQTDEPTVEQLIALEQWNAQRAAVGRGPATWA